MLFGLAIVLGLEDSEVTQFLCWVYTEHSWVASVIALSGHKLLLLCPGILAHFVGRFCFDFF